MFGLNVCTVFVYFLKNKEEMLMIITIIFFFIVLSAAPRRTDKSHDSILRYQMIRSTKAYKYGRLTPPVSQCSRRCRPT